MLDNLIIEHTRHFFEDIISLPPNALFDGVGTTKSDHCSFLIQYVKQKEEIVRHGTTYLNAVYSLVSQNKIEQLPVVVIVSRDNGKYEFGVLIYWDYDRCYLNKNIKWRELNEKNVSWLEIQVRMQHQHIRVLDNQYIRVIKTIDLNTTDLHDASVIYLRKFHDNYWMKTPPIQTEEERFHRILNGTPEDEYPEDDIDIIIFEKIKSIYPLAECKSSLLLTDTDLAKYRHLSDKIKDATQSICITALRYDSFGMVIGQGEENFSFPIEYYYYPNLFKNTCLRKFDQCLIVEETKAKEYKNLQNTYEPISELNI